MAEREQVRFIHDFFVNVTRVSKNVEKSTRRTPRVSASEARKNFIEKLVDKIRSKQPDLALSEASAKEVTSKALSTDVAQHNEAVKEMRRDRYIVRLPGEGRDILSTTKETLQKINQQTPSWLKADTIQHSDNAAEFAARIATFHPDVRDNPYILFQEALRLKHSVRSGQSREAYREDVAMIQRAFRQAIALADQDRTKYVDFSRTESECWGGTSRKFDLYRTDLLPELEDPGTPPDAHIVEVNKRRATLEQLLVDKQLSLETVDHTLEQERDILKKTRDALVNGKEVGDEGPRFNADEADRFIQKIDRRIDAIERETSEKVRKSSRRDFSTFYPTEQEKNDMDNNSLAFFEEKFRDLAAEAGDPDNEATKTTIRRLGMLAEYFFTGGVGNGEIDDPLDLIQQGYLSVNNYMDDPKRRYIAEMFATRLQRIFSLQYLYAGDIEKFAGHMLHMGQRGVSLADSTYGGLVGRWGRRFEDNLLQIIDSEIDTNQRRVTPDIILQAKKKSANQLIQEFPLLREGIKQWFADYQRGNRDVLPTSLEPILSDNPDPVKLETFANRIVEESYMSWIFRMRPLAILARTPDPAFAEFLGQTSAFQGVGYQYERIMAAFRPRDWHLRRWGVGPLDEQHSGMLQLWNHKASLVVETDPRLQTIMDGETERIWNILHSNTTNDEERKLKERTIRWVAFISQYNDPHPPKLSVKEMDGIHAYIASLDKKKLHSIVSIEIGGDVLQRNQWAYGPADSGWRQNINWNIVKELYSEETAATYRTGYDMFNATIGFFRNDFGKKVSSRNQHAERSRDDVIEAIQNWVKYNPERAARMLLEADELTIAVPQGLTRQEYLSHLEHRAMTIQDQLKLKGLPLVDYSTGTITDAQREVLRNIFQITGNGTVILDEYIDAMRSLYGMISHNDVLENFLKRSRLESMLVMNPYDDVPYWAIEDPSILQRAGVNVENYIIRHTHDGRLKGASQRHTEGGKGKEDQLARAWGDFALPALKGLPLVERLNSPDVEEFRKACGELYNSVKAYQGLTVGGSAVLLESLGWFDAAGLKAGWNLPVARDTAWASVMREIFGGDAPAYDPEKGFEEYDSIYKVILTKLADVSPTLASRVEDYLGYTGVTFEFGGKRHVLLSWHRVHHQAQEASRWLRSHRLGPLATVIDKTVNEPLSNPRTFRMLDSLFPMGIVAYKGRQFAAYSAAVLTLVVLAAATQKEESSH